MWRTGIFGPSLSGKTTLAKAIVKEYYIKFKMRALILDPHLETWDKSAIVTDQEEKFWAQVWASKNCIVLAEEAASTLRRERELIPVFTRLRHLQHKLIVVGHSGTDLLPVMRQQIDTLYLFRTPPKAAQIWAETFSDQRIIAATGLQQYEFIKAEMYKTPQKLKLKLQP